MTSLLYGLAVLTPLVLAGVSLALILVRWIEGRAEDRVRAEHGLPPRAPRPARAIEDVEGRPVAASCTSARPAGPQTPVPRTPEPSRTGGRDPSAPAHEAGPPAPADDREGARAVLARAAATLHELERAADRADRYGMKECPECDRSVRITARVCPYCRHRMAPEPERRDVTAA